MKFRVSSKVIIVEWLQRCAQLQCNKLLLSILAPLLSHHRSPLSTAYLDMIQYNNTQFKPNSQ